MTFFPPQPPPRQEGRHCSHCGVQVEHFSYICQRTAEYLCASCHDPWSAYDAPSHVRPSAARVDHPAHDGGPGNPHMEQFILLHGDDGDLTVNMRHIVAVYRLASGRASIRIAGVEKVYYLTDTYDNVWKKLRNGGR